VVSERAAIQSPYEVILADSYAALHPMVRLAHQAPLHAVGSFDVVHGRHPLTPLLHRALACR
jgi:hypothetical protein